MWRRGAAVSLEGAVLHFHPQLPPSLLGFPFPPDEEEDEEEVYKMAGVMAQCGGLECMLNRLAGIKDFKQGRHLLTVSWRQPDGTSPLLGERPLWAEACGYCHVTLEGSMVPLNSASQGRTWWLPWPSALEASPPAPLFLTHCSQKTSVIASLLLYFLVT